MHEITNKVQPLATITEVENISIPEVDISDEYNTFARQVAGTLHFSLSLRLFHVMNFTANSTIGEKIVSNETENETDENLAAGVANGNIAAGGDENLEFGGAGEDSVVGGASVDYMVGVTNEDHVVGETSAILDCGDVNEVEMNELRGMSALKIENRLDWVHMKFGYRQRSPSKFTRWNKVIIGSL